MRRLVHPTAKARGQKPRPAQPRRLPSPATITATKGSPVITGTRARSQGLAALDAVLRSRISSGEARKSALWIPELSAALTGGLGLNPCCRRTTVGILGLLDYGADSNPNGGPAFKALFPNGPDATATSARSCRCSRAASRAGRPLAPLAGHGRYVRQRDPVERWTDLVFEGSHPPPEVP